MCHHWSFGYTCSTDGVLGVVCNSGKMHPALWGWNSKEEFNNSEWHSTFLEYSKYFVHLWCMTVNHWTLSIMLQFSVTLLNWSKHLTLSIDSFIYQVSKRWIWHYYFNLNFIMIICVNESYMLDLFLRIVRTYRN